MDTFDGIFLAPGVVVTGAVSLSSGCNLWFGVVARGDVSTITLHPNVNIQDGSILHTDFDIPLVIEEGVVVGHGVILHGSRVGAHTLVGIGARLLGRSEIGPESIIAAGSLVTERTIIPPRSLVMGSPGKVVRQVTDQEVARTRDINERYRRLAKRYLEGEFPLRPTGLA